MTAAEIARIMGAQEQPGGYWLCQCPAHDDDKPSLRIEQGDTAVLMHCWAGCFFQDVVRNAGLRISDFFPDPLPRDGDSREDAWAKQAEDRTWGKIHREIKARAKTDRFWEETRYLEER